MTLDDFLTAVVTAPEGFFCLSVAAKSGGGWIDQWYKWPDNKTDIIKAAQEKSAEYNIYFSSYLFSTQRRIKANALPSRTIQSDLDEADVGNIPIKPSVLIETSPGRHQGFWILSDELPLDTHEVLSRKITYAIDKADTSSWPVGHTARMPDTLNHKYLDGPKQVKVIDAPLTTYDPSTFELLPDISKPSAQEDDEWVNAEKTPLQATPQEVMDFLLKDRRITESVHQYFNVRAQDRSRALWALTVALFRAGLNRDAVFNIVKHSVNNKFDGLRYHADRDLSRDVLRAQALATSKIPDPRNRIREYRRQPGPAFMNMQSILQVVLDVLRAEGEFIHAVNNGLYYVQRTVGRPIELARVSDNLNALLDIQFGLNPSETVHNYVKHALIDHTVSMPAHTAVAVLSAYQPHANRLLLHTGSADVLQITQDRINKVANGADNVLFLSEYGIDPFIADFTELTVPWPEIVFGNAFDNVENMTPQQAKAVMQVFVHFIVIRSAAFTRPILALFGSPGSGKSTLARRIYRLFYGRRKELTEVTSPEDFDIATTISPFIAMDNVDTWSGWLPDRLAVSISNVDVDKRKLYTDVDRITMQRQAIVGVTAHNPRFGREDVSDRLLLLTFSRLPQFHHEKEMYDAIIRNRNKIWGAIIREQQKILAQPTPSAQEAPQFRIEDFAIVGLRIARAIGVEEHFCAALKAISLEQRLFSLEEDNLLVNALTNMLIVDAKKAGAATPPTTPTERSTGVLWAMLETHAADNIAFRNMYRNANTLGKKLMALQAPLSELFVVSHRFDAKHGTRLWTFEPKNGLVKALEKRG